jgi:sodium/potassium-transporting ATPase subunit alpha
VIIIAVTSVFSYIQNRSSEAIMDSFKEVGVSKITVVRGGKGKQINATELVLGDVVKIFSGEKIPADIRIIAANDLDVNNSALTGEIHPVRLGEDCGEKGVPNPLEAFNVAFYSTLCIKGSGLGIVIQTGGNTYMGRIADLTSSAEPEETTLQKEVHDFVIKIAIVACSTGVTFFIAAIVIGYPIITDFGLAVGIVVSNVPEALPSTVTLSLAFIAKKMMTKNILVKNLESVETLGSITCICSDKTGTLTQNKMTVVHLWYDLEIKKTQPDQIKLYVDGEEIPMKLYQTNDISYKYVEFAGVCGSAAEFLKSTPDDFSPLIMKRAEIKRQNPLMPEKDFNVRINKCKL